MKLRILILLLFTSTSMLGQENYILKGAVLDSVSHLPIGYTTVIIKDAVNKQPVKSALTQDKGTFLFEGLRKHAYILCLTSLGYQNKIVQIDTTILQSDLMQNPYVIYLTAASKTLEEVTVTANRPVIKQEIDRLSYDVQADPDSKVQSVLEMMSKVPMLSVDADESIRLKGSGNYRIFINGRPSSLMARNAKDALRAMPASSVQKIEVITTPPAKYDGEGLSGIINIVTKKKLEDGYNASIGANYNNIIGTGQNASLTAKKGDFGITGRTYIYQDFKRFLETENTRKSLTPFASLLSQQGIYSYVGNYTSGNLEVSYEADSLNLLTASVNIFKRRYDDQTNQMSELYNQQNQLVQAYNLLNTNPQKESGVDLDFNYQLGFKQHKNRLLTFSYQYHNLPSRQSDEVLFDQQYNYSQNSYMQFNKNGTREQTLQLDYAHPAKIFIVEGGAKAIIRHNFSDFTNQVFNQSSNSFIPNEQLNNEFNYDQNVYSLYNSWHLRLKIAEVKAGFRLEHTRVNADFVIQATLLEQQYTNWIPVISVQRKFTNGSINLGYTQRISRPGIYQLNPFINRSNPLFISTGNPELQAVLNNNVELSYNSFAKGNYNVSLSYSFADNTIQRLITLVDTTTYTTYQNIGENKTGGLNASVSYPITKAFSLNINSQLTYIWIKGTYNSNFYTNQGLQGYAHTVLSYKINPTWRAAASLTFVSANVMLQGRTNAYYLNTYRLSKELFNKKLLVSAALNNPYSRYRYVRTTTNTADFEQLISNQRNYRTFNLSLSYSFGDLKSAIKKNRRSINNDDVLKKTQ